MRTLALLASGLVGCSHGSLHIGYDPIGSWTALSEEDWPRGEDFQADTRACTDEIRDLLGPTLVLDGTFPGWKEARTTGTATFADGPIDVEYAHDVGGGASVWPVDEIVFEDGSALNYVDLYTDRLLRVNTEAPNRSYCWTWFELD
ncbi:MAG: hypothetical protein KC621_01735 [Myxococcales bacterium]|nr:hypothetical protein [Myxococcales bacterium]